MSISREQILAIDLGNGTTSYMAGNGKEGSFASLVAQADKRTVGNESFGKDVFITKNGQCYVIGDQVREEGAANRSTDSSYYSSEHIRVLFLKVLSLAGIKNPVIVTGLPTEFCSSHKKEFAENLTKWARDEGYHPEGIKILEQFVGPWLDDQLQDVDGNNIDPKLILTGRIGVMDIGQGTIDCGLFNQGKLSDKRYGESKGVSDIHKSVFTSLQDIDRLNASMPKGAQKLPKEFKLDVLTTVYTIDTWMRDEHFMWRGQRFDFEPISRPARQQFASDTLPRAITNVWGNTDFLNAMVCAGGGVSVLGLSILKEYITCPILMARDPSMSIVRGFFRYGTKQMTKTKAEV